MKTEMRKKKSPEAVGGKEIFGVTALSTMSGMSSIFMSSMFMVYMTDYAGLGAWGATLATTLLLVARIVDAVDDPIQGFIMDSAKVGKHGKYKKFYLLSIIMTAVGTIALYSMPRAVAQIPALVTVWVIFFYFVYDIGASFYNQNILYRTITNDPNERAKLLVGPRLWDNASEYGGICDDSDCRDDSGGCGKLQHGFYDPLHGMRGHCFRGVHHRMVYGKGAPCGAAGGRGKGKDYGFL